MQSIFINDFQIHSNTLNLGYVAQMMEGMSFPGIRQTKYSRPGEHGAIVSNVLYDGRLISITGMIFAETANQFQQRRRDFESAISLVRDSYSSPIPLTLKMTTIDSLALQIDCHVQEFVMKDQEMNGQEYLLQLYAPDPAFLSQTEESFSITRGTGGGAIYPFIYPQIYGSSVGGEVILTNSGSMETYPVIYLNGSLTSPIIQNTTLGRYISLDLTLNSTDQIIIDMMNRTIIKNGSEPVISTKTSDSLFWWLEKGDNTIELFTSNNADTGNAQIKYRHAYVGK